MYHIIPQNLKNLAEICPFPLYLVGGSVRDFLCGLPLSKNADWDICAAAEEDEFVSLAQKAGLDVRAVYRNTGTVKLCDGAGVGYEFTRFRSDEYVRGLHAPSKITFVTEIATDARRRDFTANAVYYDIKEKRFCDPLGGMADIQRKILRTVAPARKVFGEDGLRLLRLCRFAAQLGFSPDKDCLDGARMHAALIRNIVPERVFHELSLILRAEGAYRGLCLLRDAQILPHVLPELALGDGMKQRADFHRYDVLEHSFRCAKYAPTEIRFAALLHDVGKPFCTLRDGNSYAHPVEGARIAREILSRLKAPKKLIEETCALISLHMLDLDCRMKESKVRRRIVENYPLLQKLFALKQADFSACKDDTSPAPTVVRWKGVLACMEAEGAPLTVSDLKIKGSDLVRLGVPPQRVGHALRELLFLAALDGSQNTRNRLLKLAEKYKEKL